MACVNDTTLARRFCLCYSVITMEKKLTTQQALDELHSKAEGSTILATIVPLFNTLNYQDEYYPNRVSEHNDYTQLLWKKGELQTGEFEQICLTLSKASLSMTIALNHRHNTKTEGVPILPGSALNTRSSSSMLIDSNSQTRYETNPTNGVWVTLDGDRNPLDVFSSDLEHTLAVIGLNQFGQDALRRAS